jgi:hypothetical protein
VVASPIVITSPSEATPPRVENPRRS